MTVTMTLTDCMGPQTLEVWVEQWSSDPTSMACDGSWEEPAFRADGQAVIQVHNLTVAQVEAIVRPTIDAYNAQAPSGATITVKFTQT